jgi:hypothetical protein
MPAMRIIILRYTDDDQPGWVECELTDARGKRWLFHEKVPIVASNRLDRATQYPLPGLIRCEVLQRWRDEQGRESATVSTERPDHVESTDGQTEFEVLSEQLEPDAD